MTDLLHRLYRTVPGGQCMNWKNTHSSKLSGVWQTFTFLYLGYLPHKHYETIFMQRWALWNTTSFIPKCIHSPPCLGAPFCSAPVWPVIRQLWAWQGPVSIQPDSSIAPCASLPLPGPKTICCKLRHGVFVGWYAAPWTWCDWVSIHATTLKLPASRQPQPTSDSLGTGQEWRGVCGPRERIPSLFPPLITAPSPGLERSGSESRDRSPPCCVAGEHHSFIHSNLIHHRS